MLRDGDHRGRAGRGAGRVGVLRAGAEGGSDLADRLRERSPERTAKLIGMLLRTPVSAGFVDKASVRLDGRLVDAGFDDAMQAALAAEPVLAADESR